MTRVITPIVDAAYTAETTLGGLLRELFKQNKFANEREAADALQEAGVRGAVTNISDWLHDRPSRGLMTTQYQTFCDVTGIDLDRLMVIQAKHLAIAKRPGLASEIKFDTMATRSEIIAEFRQWSELYGGAQVLSLQVGVPSRSLDNWVRGENRPDTENLSLLFIALARGLIMIDSVEDATFVLMVRAIIGRDPTEVFDGLKANTFAAARDLLFQPYRGWMNKKIATELDIHYSVIERLKKWRPAIGRRGTPITTIERVVRALIKQRWPQLINAFEAGCTTYRERESDGIWAIKKPIWPFIEVTKRAPSKSSETAPGQPGSSEVPEAQPQDTADASAEAAPVAADVPQPNEKLVPAPAPEPEPEPAAEPAPQALVEIAAIPAEPTSSASVPDQSMPADLAEAFEIGFRNMADLIKKTRQRAPAQPATKAAETPAPRQVPTDDEIIGETIQGVRHCLTKASLKPKPGARLDPETVENVRAAIEGLRKSIVLVCGYDSEYLIDELRLVLGHELTELFLTTKGLKYLLPTEEAWKAIEATRASMGLAKRARGE